MAWKIRTTRRLDLQPVVVRHRVDALEALPVRPLELRQQRFFAGNGPDFDWNHKMAATAVNCFLRTKKSEESRLRFA